MEIKNKCLPLRRTKYYNIMENNETALMGNRIKEVMQQKGVTYQDLQKVQGVSLATVYNWANNDNQPALMKFYDIAKQLGCCVHHLIHPSPVPKELEPELADAE